MTITIPAPIREVTVEFLISWHYGVHILPGQTGKPLSTRMSYTASIAPLDGVRIEYRWITRGADAVLWLATDDGHRVQIPLAGQGHVVEPQFDDLFDAWIGLLRNYPKENTTCEPSTPDNFVSGMSSTVRSITAGVS